ncbi:hypothetical protein AM588_10006606 [Phytophthora nicotianae]|uniref:PIPK domain-containing protein n=1 Tax=Phytophthora nicotianae TaxID=4792 RepID=A0A0W8DEZ4_PHYNI|nr:hypothetical protein AM588_10006606 [Phytophthora nicotianae]
MGMLFHGTVLAQTSATYGTCCTTAPVVQLALLSHELYFFALAFNFYFTTKFPFRSSRWLNPIYHVVVWGTSVAVTIVAWQLGTGRVSSYGYCWYAAEDDSDNNDGEFILLEIFFIPVCAGYCNPNAGFGHAEFVVGKDLNWSCRRLGLPTDVAEQLGSQLYADTEFLQRMNSMDYSLVIGLSRHKSISTSSGGGTVLSRSGGPPVKGKLFVGGNSSDEAGYLESLSPNGATLQGLSRPRGNLTTFSADACVVNMGIIDILTPWSFKKSLERWVRVRLQCRDAKGISCMKPIPYADRFRRNVIDTVIFGRRLGSKRRHPEKQQGESIMVDFTSMSMDVNFSMDIANLSMDTTSNLSMEI